MENYLSDKKLFILDMDGTFYLDNQIFEGSLEFIQKLRRSGKDFLFFTNNASKSPSFYIEKLKRMGCYIERTNILTAGDVTIEFLKQNRSGKKVFLLGTDMLMESFSNSGIELVDIDKNDNPIAAHNKPITKYNKPITTHNKPITTHETPEIVVVSFDLTLTYDKVSKACTYIREGAEFIATHMDLNCPTQTGFIPDCGSICAMITASTGKTPRYFGKPFRETIDMISTITGFQKEDMVIIGDRLYTDIATGFRNGVTSILVLSGETKLEDLDNSEIKPDYIFNALKDIEI